MHSLRMSRKSNIDQATIQNAQIAADSASTIQELRRAQAVLLPALFGVTLTQTAAVLGVGRATVSRLRSSFKTTAENPAEKPKKKWGGRRNCWMSWEEEVAFLAPWIEGAASGTLVVVSPVRAALAQRIGQPVKASVVYRMLARHGWRKVAPDTRHPKCDPIAQEDWKKNYRKRWNSC